MSPASNTVVVITGASSGIGAASAREFARHGARLVLAARRVERLEALAREVIELGTGADAIAVPTDLSRLADIERLIEGTLDRYGRIDVLFNNAGFGKLDWLERLDAAKDVQAQVEVDLLALMQATRLVLPAMMRQRSGHVINMASLAGLVGVPTYTVYAACKYGVRGFSEALRREVRPWGIRVSCVFPFGVETEFGDHAGIRRRTGVTTPRLLRLSAADVARAVVGLVRRPRVELILPWPMRLAVWLNHALPSLMDYAILRWFTLPERRGDLERTS